MTLKRVVVFLLVLIFSQLLAWWICHASGFVFGTDESGMTYTIALVFGLCLAAPVAEAVK